MIALPRFQLFAPEWVLELLTHLWQSTLVGLAILLLLRLAGRRLSTRTRRALAWMAAAKFALPAAWLTKALGALRDAVSAGPEPAFTAGSHVETLSLIARAASDAGPVWPAPSWLWPAFSLVWIAGFVGLAARWISRGRKLRAQLWREATPASPAVARAVSRAARRVGLREAPRCVEVGGAHAPGVLGIVAPVLVLPRGFAATLGPAELESILVHECVHVRRRDNLLAAQRAGFVAVLWFNPVAWWINRVLAAEAEKSCDERVLELTGDPSSYARGIAAAVRHALGVNQPGFAAVATPPVLGRIQNILTLSARPERRWLRRLALCGGAAVLASSGRIQGLAIGATAPAPAAATPGTPAPGTPAPVAPAKHRIGTIKITFTGPSVVTEQAVRALLQAREGGEFDEQTVDRDIRALYRLGSFEFVELRHVPGTGGATNFEFILTPKNTAAAPSPESDKTAGASVTPAPPTDAASRIRSLEEELAHAKQLAADANAELKRMREERATAVAQDKALQTARSEARPQEQPASTATPLPRPARDELRPLPGPTISAARPVPPAVPMRTPVYRGMLVHEIADVEKPPMPRFQARPQYPFEMRRRGINGEVVVDFIVDTEGNVVNAFALRSSREEFESAAVAAVSKWRFRPGEKSGRPVPTRLQVPIVFTID